MHSRYKSGLPDAQAILSGSPKAPQVRGVVSFFQTDNGVLVQAQVYGLPDSNVPCAVNIYAFHIHEGSTCTGNESDPFADTGSHYNPTDCPHPAHAGDMPPLFGSHGYAFSEFFTDRFSVEEVIGRTVVIHAGPDDFTTQPAGNAGAKIACGPIVSVAVPQYRSLL